MLFDRDFLKHHRAGVMGGVMGGEGYTLLWCLV